LCYPSVSDHILSAGAGEKSIQVLQVAARELLVGNDLDLSIALLADGDSIAQVSGAAINLDAIVEEFLKGREIEDLVVHRLGRVDDELLGDLGALAFGGFLL